MACDALDGALCQEVGSLVNEFFRDGTSNQRKHEIECRLSELSRQEGSWRQWLRLLCGNKDPGLLAFAFSALQDAISRRGLDLSARQELRSSLQHLLLSAQQQPAYVRNKLSKLLVDLACVDWPHNEPGFFDDIAQLCQSEETRPLGLLLLQTTSEEVATAPRGNVTAARLDELRRLVVQQMPRMWALITGVLKSGSDGGVNIHRALQCTEHLLSWLPLSAVDPKLVDALCCLCATAAASASQESQTQVETEELGALSLSCLCEALSRATASDMGSDCLRLLQQFAMGALQAAIPSAAAASSHNSYLDKLMEFLRLFVSASLPCFEGNSPALPQLLSLLYEYTFRESSAERYCVCLEMWGTLLVRLAAHRSADSYRPLLQTLVSQLLARCCQAEGAAQSLQEPQLALVAKAAELTPQDVCAQVLSLLDPELDDYQSPHGGSAAERLRSLSAVLQALGRLAPHLDVSLAHTTTTRLCHAAIYGRQLLANADAARAADVANAQAHLLASLRLLCTYLGSKSPPTELVVEAALPPILEQCPENVCRAACGLLLSLSSSVRPAQLLSLEPMQQLCEQLCQGSLRPLSPQCEQLVVQAAHAALCLPWSGVPAAAQCWDQRAVAQSSLVNALAQPLLQKQPPGEPVNRSLRLLRALVEVLEGSGSRSKQVASTGLVPVWPLLLERLPATLQAGVEDPVLGVLACLVRVMAAQMGATRVGPLLAVLEQRVSRECEEAKSAVSGLEWLLALLLPLVREPSLGEFLPAVLRLCLDQVHPRLAQCPALVPVLGPPLFELLEQCLVCHWRRFFPGGVAAPEELHNGLEFGRLLSAYGWSLRMGEPGLVRQNLLALSALNRRCRLFHKAAFRECFLGQFVEALLSCLVSSPVRDLLRDEFQQLLFELAAVDFEMFYGHLLPALIPPEPLASLAWERDLPSFSRQMERLVGDLRRAAG
ncbi:exportin ellipsoid body open isoform X2 [Rhipicephalus microplus]